VLTGHDDARTAAQLLSEQYGEVVVKLGAGGALWHGGFVGASAPAERVEDVVDTTGAGDAFAAGFLAEWLLHPEPESALTAANRLAAGAVARVGARPPLR
jgi:sugar/nucleoside kinase (ribokinase family)